MLVKFKLWLVAANPCQVSSPRSNHTLRGMEFLLRIEQTGPKLLPPEANL